MASWRVESELVAHIAEVDGRRLYAREASSSMFKYATDVLHLSEAEAYLRIAAARASRRHPVLLKMLDDGRLHLSGIAVLAPHLTDANCEELLARATYKTKRELLVLVAEIAPKPDVAPSIRKLPRSRQTPASEHRMSGAESTPSGKSSLAPEPGSVNRSRRFYSFRTELRRGHRLHVVPDALAPGLPELLFKVSIVTATGTQFPGSPSCGTAGESRSLFGSLCRG